MSRTIRTLDNTPPFFLPGHPRVAAVVPTGATLEVRVDETAAVWVVVVPFGSVATPTSADVAAVAAAAAGATSGVAHVAVTATSPALASARASSALGDTESKRSGAGDDVLPLVLTLTGLSPSTRYDAYVVARDFVGREEVGSGGVDAVNLLQDLPTKIAIVTPDAAAWLESLTPSVGTLEPRFDPSAGSYRLLLPDPALPGVAAPSVSFVAAVANEDWVVTVDGVEAMPGVASAPVLVGADAVEVIVRVAPRADALPPGAAAAAAAETPATYKIAAMRSSVAAAARAADATLALLHVALDTGDSFNATDLGGESWPGCHRACRPPGTSPPCASSCALDPSQRRYPARRADVRGRRDDHDGDHVPRRDRESVRRPPGGGSRRRERGGVGRGRGGGGRGGRVARRDGRRRVASPGGTQRAVPGRGGALRPRHVRGRHARGVLRRRRATDRAGGVRARRRRRRRGLGGGEPRGRGSRVGEQDGAERTEAAGGARERAAADVLPEVRTTTGVSGDGGRGYLFALALDLASILSEEENVDSTRPPSFHVVLLVNTVRDG